MKVNRWVFTRWAHFISLATLFKLHTNGKLNKLSPHGSPGSFTATSSQQIDRKHQHKAWTFSVSIAQVSHQQRRWRRRQPWCWWPVATQPHLNAAAIKQHINVEVETCKLGQSLGGLLLLGFQGRGWTSKRGPPPPLLEARKAGRCPLPPFTALRPFLLGITTHYEEEGKYLSVCPRFPFLLSVPPLKHSTFLFGWSKHILTTNKQKREEPAAFHESRVYGTEV